MSNQDSLELAMDLYESGQINRARDICHLLFQQNQENSLLHFLMGLIAIKEKKPRTHSFDLRRPFLWIRLYPSICSVWAKL
ncbi:MAG: hypothetical protein CMM74_10660, partial [Rhodospirillaceae bacterium]|nr:hypothetical protein [Rhodospirillaceae bacterium]